MWRACAASCAVAIEVEWPRVLPAPRPNEHPAAYAARVCTRDAFVRGGAAEGGAGGGMWGKGDAGMQAGEDKGDTGGTWGQRSSSTGSINYTAGTLGSGGVGRGGGGGGDASVGVGWVDASVALKALSVALEGIACQPGKRQGHKHMRGDDDGLVHKGIGTQVKVRARGAWMRWWGRRGEARRRGRQCGSHP